MEENYKIVDLKLNVDLTNIYNKEDKKIYSDLLKYITKSKKYTLLLKEKYY